METSALSTKNTAIVRGTVRIATHDYVGCRCLFMSHCHLSGFLLGQQAVEKLLKAWILANGVDLIKGKGSASHDLLKYAELARTAAGGAMDLSQHSALLASMTEVFIGKYADKAMARGALSSTGTLAEIDEIVLKLVTKILPLVEFSHIGFINEVQAGAAMGWYRPEARWMLSGNAAMERRPEFLEKYLSSDQIASVLEVIHTPGGGAPGYKGTYEATYR